MVNKLSAHPTSDGRVDSVDANVFRAIADYTYDWEGWHAPDGRLLWVNAAVERMTGCSPAECLTMSDYPLPLVAEKDRERIRQVMQDAIAGGRGNDLEFCSVHRDGSTCWLAVSWQPMLDETRGHLGFRTSVRDVTERHQLREELRLHNQHLEQLVQERTARIAHLEEHRLKMEKLAALGQLAAGVAHEVNNPLAGIRNAFTLIKADLSLDDEHLELLDLIDREIDRISSITHQMYQLYCPSQHQPGRFDLRRTIADTEMLLQPQAAKAGVRIECQAGKCQSFQSLAKTEVVLQEGEVKQVLLNLVRNAIQASASGDTVQVKLDTSPQYATVRVIDHGDGVPDQVVSRIFDPFFSTKAHTPGQGMGLGLSVSRSLIEAMGGTIEVDSRKGVGSCFQVRFPRQLHSHE